MSGEKGCGRAEHAEQVSGEASKPNPLWEKESPLLSLVPVIGPYLAQRESGLTGMSVAQNGAVSEEYAHRTDGLTKVRTNCDGSVFAQYDPLRSNGVLTTFEKMPTRFDRNGFRITVYDPARTDGLQRSESRFGTGGWVKETFEPRTDGLLEILQEGKALTKLYDPAKTGGLYKHGHAIGGVEFWEYKEGTQPNGLVKETRLKEPFGYLKEFAGRPDHLVRREWNRDLKDNDGSSITIQTYANGRKRELLDWDLETELRKEKN